MGVVISAEFGVAVMMTHADFDAAIDARTARSLARDLKDYALASLLALVVVELARRSRRGGWRSGSTGVVASADSASRSL